MLVARVATMRVYMFIELEGDLIRKRCLTIRQRKNCELMDLVLIELTRAISMARLSNLLKKSPICFRLCLYSETFFQQVSVSML